MSLLQSISREYVLKNLPNWLTYFRLALIPVFVMLMHDPSQLMAQAAIAVFILAALTDFADGYLARRFGAVSDIGKLLDPLADKILVMAGLVMMVAQRSQLDGLPWVPGWMVVIVVAREFWVTGLRGMAAANGLIVPAGSAGKIKSGFQMVAVVFLLLHKTPISNFGIPFEVTAQFIGLNLLMISIFFSIWSAAEYTFAVLKSRS
jgi:CDP-diacylglycerol--glycerol-3-phosphate 3-phosphatidyltransferase